MGGRTIGDGELEGDVGRLRARRATEPYQRVSDQQRGATAHAGRLSLARSTSGGAHCQARFSELEQQGR